MTYSEKLKHPFWQRKRLEIFKRDDFACQDCGRFESMLVVHHLKYYKKKEPWDIEDEYLITLCETCHDERHEEKKAVDYINQLINEEYKQKWYHEWDRGEINFKYECERFIWNIFQYIAQDKKGSLLMDHSEILFKLMFEKLKIKLVYKNGKKIY